ncbi:MAG: hypothetical protein V4675_17270 [Verrucomicrobiota bacterium]
MNTLSPLLNPNIQFVAEDEADAMRRYTRFAADFHTRLYSEYSAVRGRFRFFRDPSSDDIWSVCDRGDYSFGVQLDPDIEVICIWDTSGWFDEIGTWMSDPIAYAIEKIRERYIRCAQ